MDVRHNAARLIDDDPEGLLRYIRGVLALKEKTRRGSSISIYDEMVAIHKGVASLPFSPDWVVRMGADPTEIPGLADGPAAGVDGAHRGPAFLPWHRVYLRRLEIELQAVLDDPTVTVPYWDWTDTAGTQALFHEDFLGPDGGGGPIPAGFFTPDNFPVRPDLQFRLQGQQVVTLGTGLIREMRPFAELPAPAEVEAALLIADYDPFRIFLEGEGQRLHDFIHGWVGGSMAMMTSPNDPIFFMHHAFIDMIWARWQRDRRREWEEDPAHDGQIYDPRIHYVVPADTPHGHRLDDPMWPWDLGASAPAVFLPGQNPFPVLQGLFLTADVPVSAYSVGDRMRVADALSHRALGFTYDVLEE